MLKPVLFVFFFPVCLFAQSTDSLAISVDRYFKEAMLISAKDNGRLWGRNLYGPMIFVDPGSGTAVANERDSAGSFTRLGNVWIGKVPPSFGSNTAKAWGGKIWTVILWPLPGDKNERAILMAHELFHQLQHHIGLPGSSTASAHLDRFEGRLLLKLELEALRKVINEYPSFSKTDLTNAIALRRLRYQTYPDADSLEHSLEFNEGLATFTGFRLSGLPVPESKQLINKKLDEFYTNKTFVRSLGYITGYMYGFLLSRKDSGWSRHISEPFIAKNKISFAVLKKLASFDQSVISLYHIDIPVSLQGVLSSIADSGKYGYPSVYAFEKNRERDRVAVEAGNRHKFVDGPILELPNAHMAFNFNPNEVQMLEGVGPIYPVFLGKADWGTLDVKKEGVLVRDWMKVYVPLPPGFDSKQQSIKTDNWQLDLNDGWTIIEGDRKGDFKVVKR